MPVRLPVPGDPRAVTAPPTAQAAAGVIPPRLSTFEPALCSGDLASLGPRECRLTPVYPDQVAVGPLPVFERRKRYRLALPPRWPARHWRQQGLGEDAARADGTLRDVEACSGSAR